MDMSMSCSTFRGSNLEKSFFFQGRELNLHSLTFISIVLYIWHHLFSDKTSYLCLTVWTSLSYDFVLL